MATAPNTLVPTRDTGSGNTLASGPLTALPSRVVFLVVSLVWPF